MDNNPSEKSFFSPFIVTKPQTEEPVLTMAFVNMQPVTEIYTPKEALENGTLFKNINKPFYGKDDVC